ncbi:B12-binding domain-containing radical SAM protein [Verrucosispora sioxanthis]|uniref:Radical SAM protein n=1 Tax=Verrucosispora sioxanthis TaxID=2499994 RepID=A0A6M1L4L2_9ACTN|nr:radical SAM protein [Verrucosispora sioxanthis]NEE65091.1 radical SAM protein [Verrucosispora sioxanthis]NGM14201.1 radical SAM protein [Verrucosispora sioxanthis]
MPHSALPLLKGYITRHSQHSVTCHDLNIEFFRDLVIGSSLGPDLARFRKRLHSAPDAAAGIKVAFEFDRWLKACFKSWAVVNPGYALTLRSLGTPYDRRDIQQIREFMDVGSTPFDGLFDRLLNSLEGRAVGINLSVEDQILPAFRLATLVKRHFPDAVVVWGGSLLSRLYPIVEGAFGDVWDYLVRREGEEPLLAILDSVENGRPLTRSDDRIVTKSSAGGAVMVAPFVTNAVTAIDETGDGEYSDYQVENYVSLVPILPVLASRKCYWGRCKFCTIHESWDPRFRTRAASAVCDEISSLVSKYGVRYFRFVDEAIPPDLIRSMLPRLKEMGIEFEVYAIAEARFRNEAFVSELGAAGCRQAYFGLESADEAAIASMGKRINQVRHYSEIFSNCARAGVHVYVYTLFGYPGSSAEAEERTVRFILSEPALHSVTIASFVPVTGSPYAEINRDSLVHTGRFTEDYEQATCGSAELDIAAKGREAAESAIESIYGERRDLALTAALNDEMRLALSSRYGPDFARTVHCDELEFLDQIVNAGKQLMSRERVARVLDVDDDW